jgi:hypothetical protein
LTTRYYFRNAVSAFFEFPTETASDLLPAHLQPLEVQHGSGVLALTAFDFTDSMVGVYQEIVLAVIAPPRVQPGAEFPKSAFYPFIVGTSSRESREHAIERWRLPHYMNDVDVDFEGADHRIQIQVREGNKPILDFAVTDHEWAKVDHLYQAFMVDAEHRHKVDIRMKGHFTEHEEERGGLTLHDHPICEKLCADDIAERPFRELWMKEGVQEFEELETHQLR